jgi:hypothetical protein
VGTDTPFPSRIRRFIDDPRLDGDEARTSGIEFESARRICEPDFDSFEAVGEAV